MNPPSTAQIPRTRLGALEVPRMGLGCMGMSLAYGRPDPEAGVRTISHALDRGVGFLDTADMYANGSNEELVSRAIAGRRDEVVLATKCGITTVPGIGLPRGVNGDPAYIRRSAEASLARLGVDVIDLYYLHRVDPQVPIEESVGAMAELVERGLVREIGLSEVDPADLRRAHDTHPIAAVEMEWSIVSRELEDDIVPLARELGIGIVCYSPISRGMLSGDDAGLKPGLLDFRRFLPRWSRKNRAHNSRLVDTVKAVAARRGATPAQVALAWLLAKGEDVIPIPGTSKPHRLDENLGAFEVTLSDEDMHILNGLTAAGERYGRTGGA
ncbi:aldo/keto reductase [Brevibacterium linens]|uniref:Predicted oxidoreductase n=1 Tax=Brevibacterium linens TaxID=1703 RepID=A0A2H1I6H1_BRELN|nr:aldo/keto reductase [Brevibacterium linens]SMX70811.1 Predicted oxidoreductase [Brevibacterium linens]